MEGQLEEDLVYQLAQGDLYVERRCADLAELLSCAGAGLGQVALISLELENVDKPLVAALHGFGLRVVLACAPGEEGRAAQLADSFVPFDASADAVISVLRHVADLDDAAPLAALLSRPVPADPSFLVTDPAAGEAAGWMASSPAGSDLAAAADGAPTWEASGAGASWAPGASWEGSSTGDSSPAGARAGDAAEWAAGAVAGPAGEQAAFWAEGCADNLGAVPAAQVPGGAPDRLQTLPAPSWATAALGGGAQEQPQPGTAGAPQGDLGLAPGTMPGAVLFPPDGAGFEQNSALQGATSCGVPVFGAPGAAVWPGDGGSGAAGEGPTGQLVAVWSGPGAPGRTVLAIEVAAEAAAQGHRVLLVDADTLGPCVAQSLGFLAESSAIAVACRHAAHGRLEPALLAQLVAQVEPGFDLLAGLTRSDRWREVPAAALEVLWDVAKRSYDVVIVDMAGALLDPGANAAYGPSRDDATLSALEAATVVLLVGATDPVSVRRLVAASGQLQEDKLSEAPVVVALNRAPTQSRTVEEAVAVTHRYTGRERIIAIPQATQQVEKALLYGRPARAPKTALTKAISQLTQLLVGQPARSQANAPARRRRR